MNTQVRGSPRYKRYLDEMPGSPITDVWTDIRPINSQAQERLGYPTQKPLALLERIISASSNEGDLVLDPFCGCGTTVHAAQKLNRRWIGIDVTHLAIHLHSAASERRLSRNPIRDRRRAKRSRRRPRACRPRQIRVPEMGARDDRRPALQRWQEGRRRRRGRFSLYKTRRQEDRKSHRLGQGRPEPQSGDGARISIVTVDQEGRQDGRVS